MESTRDQKQRKQNAFLDRSLDHPLLNPEGAHAISDAYQRRPTNVLEDGAGAAAQTTGRDSLLIALHQSEELAEDHQSKQTYGAPHERLSLDKCLKVDRSQVHQEGLLLADPEMRWSSFAQGQFRSVNEHNNMFVSCQTEDILYEEEMKQTLYSDDNVDDSFIRQDANSVMRAHFSNPNLGRSSFVSGHSTNASALMIDGEEKEIVDQSFKLRRSDFFAYFVGICARIQTFVIAFFLFKVETRNVCVVPGDSMQPLQMNQLPSNLYYLPGNFAVMNLVFECILFSLLVISTATTIIYIHKVITVVAYHKSSSEVYMAKAMPAVRRAKIWNSIVGMSHLACACVFLTHAGRVCSGWYIPSLKSQGLLPENEGTGFDKQTYLIARGGWFVMASLFGLGNLIAFIVVGRKAKN